MAKRVVQNNTTPEEVEQFIKGGETIIVTPLQEEVSRSYLEYAYSVIHSRALPDARDGLKPVHRRILFTMFEDGLTPSHSHVKSARVVGSALGRYHPHGDSSVYEAMVRLAQNFSLNTPLVDGHGNFGSPNDSPAAARYCVVGETQVKLSNGVSCAIGKLSRLKSAGEENVNFDVLDMNGKPAPVVKVFHSGKWPALKVKTSLGYQTIGTHNHPIIVLKRNENSGIPEIRWTELGTVSAGDKVALFGGVDVPHTSTVPHEVDVERGESFADEIIRATESGNDSHLLRTLEKVWVSNADVKAICLAKIAERNVTSPVLFPTEKVTISVQELFLDAGFITQQTFGETWFGFKIVGSVDSVKDDTYHTHNVVPYAEEYIQQFITPVNVPPNTSLGCSSCWVDYTKQELLYATNFNYNIVNALQYVMESGYIFAPVVRVENAGERNVFSLKVDNENHSFLGGGFVHHNTEARMTESAMLMVKELKEETVDFVPNYDGSLEEPTVLPTLFPNLLINGTSGIAVGMATNMIPHNPSEAMAAARALLKNPKMSVEKIMEYIPGPDLPTGGALVGMDEVYNAYTTGRGTVRIRAKTRIEQIMNARGRSAIVVYELPYQVGTEKIIESIKTEIGKKRLQGISDVKDLSDRRNGIRLVIECKTGVNPSVLLNELYKYTPLETSFGVNNLTLVKGKPETLNLKQLLEVFLEHRTDVVLRRTRYRLKRAEARKHIVEGLLIALANIEEVVKTIRSSKDTADAKVKLMKKFKLTDIQTQHILEMPLRRLVNLEVETLKKEHLELENTIKHLRSILDDEKVLKKTIDQELAEVEKTISSPRKTELIQGDLKEIITTTANESAQLKISDENVTVYLSLSGLLVRTPGKTEDTSHIKNARRGSRAHEMVLSVASTTTHGDFLIVTNFGRCFRTKTLDIPPQKPETKIFTTATGIPVSDLVTLQPNEKAVFIVPANNYEPNIRGIAVGTKLGVVKTCTTEWPTRSDEFEIISLKPGDEIVGGGLSHSGGAFVFITNAGNLLTFPSDSVRPQGRTGGGMAGVKLPNTTTSVISFTSVMSSSDSLVFTHTGITGKTTPLSEYPSKGRGTGGVRCHKFLKGETGLLTAFVGENVCVAVDSNSNTTDIGNFSGKRDGSGKPLSNFSGVANCINA